MAIEIVSFSIKTGDFPWQNVSLPEGNRLAHFNPFLSRRVSHVIFDAGSLNGWYVPGLVNVYIANWKDPTSFN